MVSNKKIYAECKLCFKSIEIKTNKTFYCHLRKDHAGISQCEYAQKTDILDIIQRYKSGYSGKQIAEELNNIDGNIFHCQKKSIFDFLDKNGISRRNTSEAIESWSKILGGPWNKGKTKNDHPSIKRYADSRKGKNNPYFKASEAAKERIAKSGAYNRLSSYEKIITKYLIELDIKFIAQYKIDRFYYDFFLPEYELCIEFNGSYWHCDPRIYKEDFSNKRELAKDVWEKDARKKNAALLKHKNFLTIWELDFKNNKEYLLEEIKNAVCKDKKDLQEGKAI